MPCFVISHRAAASSATRPRPSLPLSALLSKAPQLFDRSKISAVEKFITVIDELPVRYQEAQVRSWRTYTGGLCYPA